jgi:type I restriction enzyme S subunit
VSWPTVALGEIAERVRNGIFARRPTDEPTGTRILRISAVRDGRVNLGDAKFVTGLEPKQLDQFSINCGDLLITRYNGSRALVGTAGIVPAHEGCVIHPDKLIRVVIDRDRADPRFVNYQFQSPQVRTHLEPRIRTTAGQSGIAGGDVRSVPVVLPSLAEQRRVVDLLEGHFSRLDAAADYLRAATRRLESMVSAILFDLIPDEGSYPESWIRSTVSEAGTIGLGRQRHPDWHEGLNMWPYLRVANVFENRIDTSDVMEMHWPENTFERFRLHPGDILLNEGQTPDLLGRPALYRGDPPDVAFTNSLLRFKAGPNVLAEFALLVFRRHMRAGRFKRESRITTNIAHLSAARLKPIEFPVPPIGEQLVIIEKAESQLESVRRLRSELDTAKARQTNLRRSLLAAAFSGRLTQVAPGLSETPENVSA